MRFVALFSRWNKLVELNGIQLKLVHNLLKESLVPSKRLRPAYYLMIKDFF